MSAQVLMQLLTTLDRLVRVEERQAAALERIATTPTPGSASLKPRNKRQRKQHPPKPPAKAVPIDDITRARASKLLRNAGVK